MDAFSGPSVSAEARLPDLLPHSPSEFRDMLLRAGEIDLGPNGIPDKNTANAWLLAFSRVVDAYVVPLLDPPHEIWLPPRIHLSLIEAASTLLLKLNGFPHLFSDHEGTARRIIAPLVAFYLLLDEYEDRDDLADDRSSVTGARLQHLTFQVLALTLRDLGDDSKASLDIIPELNESAAERPISLNMILNQFLVASNDVVLRQETALYPCIVPILDTGRIRTRMDDSDTVPANHVVLRNEDEAALLSSLLASVVAAVLSSRFNASDFTTAILGLHVGNTIRTTSTSLLSGSWSVPHDKISEHLSLLITHLRALSVAHSSASLQDIFFDLRHRLLLFRVHARNPASCAQLDTALTSCASPPARTAATATCLAVLHELLQADPDDHALKALVVRYITDHIPHLDHESLEVLKSRLPAEVVYEPVFEAVQQQLGIPDAAAPPTMDVDSLVSSPRLDRIVVCLQALVVSDQDAGTEDMAGMTNSDLMAHILWLIGQGFPVSLEGTTPEAQAHLLKRMIELPCLVLDCSTSDCKRWDHADRESVLSVYMRLFARFPDGARTNASVNKLAFRAMASATRHDAPEAMETADTALLSDKAVKDALTHKDRSVRLAAGRTLVENVRFYKLVGTTPALRHIEAFIDVFYHIFSSRSEAMKESTLLTVGAVARASSSDILCAAICCLVSQLGNVNPVVNSIACTQIMSLAGPNGALYRILSPYFESISAYAVGRWCTQPNMLAEFCRLLGFSTLDFVKMNLEATIPALFAERSQRVLEKVSKEIGIRLPKLLYDLRSEVLALILLLPQDQSDASLAFVMKYFAASATGAVNIETVVRGCYTELLSSLVVRLGDESPQVVETAKEALQKLDRLMPNDRKRQRSGEPKGDLKGLLRSQILSVTSYMTDSLQEFKGRISIVSKRRILRSFGQLAQILLADIGCIAPQIMTAFQTALTTPELSDFALDSWYKLLQAMPVEDIALHLGSITATMVANWSSLSEHGRALVTNCLKLLIVTLYSDLEPQLDQVVDMHHIPQLSGLNSVLRKRRRTHTPERRLESLLKKVNSDNIFVVLLSLRELKEYMVNHRTWFSGLSRGDFFNPLVGQTLSVLLSASSRDGEGAEAIRLMAYECIGILGAVDPDRLHLEPQAPPMVVLRNFSEEDEGVQFVAYLISDVLVAAFRATGVIQYQKHLSYAMQELLKFCHFTPALVSSTSSSSVPARVLHGWKRVPQDVYDVVIPLLDSKFTRIVETHDVLTPPFYHTQPSYREWLAAWATYLVSQVSGRSAKVIFGHLEHTISKDDVSVAYRLLPHLVLNVILSGSESNIDAVRSEMVSVLEDQVNSASTSAKDKQLLSAQIIFMLMDHIQRWIRQARQELVPKKNGDAPRRRSPNSDGAEEQITSVDSIISSIEQSLVAQAAFGCKAYARSLMSFERHVLALRDRRAPERELQHCYDRIHEIYANLDEPDGMAGISTLITEQSLDHQIREHESNGQWTSAQSCWELSLQQSPDKFECHKGLLQCLRHLGHYDTMRTHAKGVLVSKPEWKSDLADFQVEGAWMMGAWDEVQSFIESASPDSAQMAIARVLVAMQGGRDEAVTDALAKARAVLGRPVSAAAPGEYRRCYDAVLSLHALYELEMVRSATSTTTQAPHVLLENLSRSLGIRFDATQPSYRVREPLLSMRRVALTLCSPRLPALHDEIGKFWLTSTKIARKAGHMSTAYSALLQAQHRKTPYAFIQAVKLVKASGDSNRALRDLEHHLRIAEAADASVIDLTEEGDEETALLKAKATLLRARWANESDSYGKKDVQALFVTAEELLPKHESAMFYFGKFQDQFNARTRKGKDNDRMHAVQWELVTVRYFLRAIRYGSKFTYQSVPRVLMIWLDTGEDALLATTEHFKLMTAEMEQALPDIPAYKWYTAFPQITSRVDHINHDNVWPTLSKLIQNVIAEYPQQGLWQFASVVKSRNGTRSGRGREVLNKLKRLPAPKDSGVEHVSKTIVTSSNMVAELLNLCDLGVGDQHVFSMKRHIPSLARLAPSKLIIPLQESLLASLPPTSAQVDATHLPFPTILPTFAVFHDEVEVMRSLAKPRKITITGSDGKTYMFLGKPKDDLRKDARLMDFDALINKLLKADSEARRRQLFIRTYAVVTLNEECGFIQWVPNTTPVRPILLKAYDALGVKSYGNEVGAAYAKIKGATDQHAVKIFTQTVLPMFPPVFHDWYLETFPEPSTWLAARQTYGRTLAVMSIVGWILGLGDRHCENILVDENSGAVVHVDFNCLFERGQLLDTPERVPFRLTNNIVDGLGITGVEGVYRRACEIAFQIMRDNSDALRSVLDAFIHDPLVEWLDMSRTLQSKNKHGASNSKSNTNPKRPPTEQDIRQEKAKLVELARVALDPIARKLKGIHTASVDSGLRSMSTQALVQVLIEEATNPLNLAKMYPGWAPQH